MLAETRHSRILARVQEVGEASVGELAQMLQASPATIRRDLGVLDNAGYLQRVHGGARAQSLLHEVESRPFREVAETSLESKRRIARRAAEIVSDGDVVLLDIGTTTALVARELRGRAITVVTASIAVLDELRDDPVVELVLLGGTLRRSYHSLVGPITEDALSRIHATIAFIGTSGVTADGTVLDTTMVEVPVKQAIARIASRVVLVADEAKFPGSGVLQAIGPKDFHTLVTSELSDAGTLETLVHLGIEVIQT